MHAGYLKVLFDQKLFDKAVDKMSAQLVKDKKQYNVNCIIATGLSGLVMASAVAYHTKTPLVAIRKKERSHSNLQVEYPDCLNPIVGILIDDQVATGRTAKRVCDHIYKLKGKIIGIYLYHYCSADQRVHPYEYFYRNKLVDSINISDLTVVDL